MTTVGLVQINQGFSGQSYFPYSVGVLEAHARAYLSRPDAYRFLVPVYRREKVMAAVEQLLTADVVGFSLYVWNEQLSLAIARELKTRRPDTLIVVGGPQVPDHADHLHKHDHTTGSAPLIQLGASPADRVEQFLKRHPYVDAAVHGEGEQVFTRILEAPERWRETPSISFLADGRARHTERLPRLANLDDVPSPYLTGTFAPLMAASPDHAWIAMWETNRGCPFSCTFCDWGSAVAAKVTRWSEERLFREIEWFAQQQIMFVFCADANFGILPRDVELARYAAQVKARTGFPCKLSVQSTKNAENRAYAVQKILSDADLNQGVVVSMQSMDPQTLKDIKRANISTTAFKKLQREFTLGGVDTMSDLILGLPGETYDSFANGVSRLIEGGQHNRIQFNNLSILPNAEMGDPAYQARHGMQSVRSRIINIHGSREEEDEVAEYQELVIATGSMSREDWVRTRAFAWMVGLLHFDKLLQIPLIVAHTLSSVSYRDLIELFSSGRLADVGDFPLLQRMREFFLAKARDIQSGGEEYCYSKEHLGIFWPADELFLIRLATAGDLQTFYREAEEALARFLAARAANVPRVVLHDAIRLNQALIKQPFQSGNLVVDLGWNVWELYRGAVRGESVDLVERSSRYLVDRTTERWDSWAEWCQKVVWWGNKRGAYLYGNTPQVQLAGHF